MTFAHPELLLLLWLVPAPAALAVVSRRRKLRRAALISAAAGRRGSGLFVAQCALLGVALAAMIFAAARPRWGTREQTVHGSGRNVMIVLDVSRSMLARDVHPNRLVRAKADLADLVASLDGDRAGLIAFRKGARIICPFTTDRAFLAQALEGVHVDSAPRGETDIGSGIAMALDAFKNLGSDHNAIILISDGEDLAGEAFAQARAAAERGITIFCVGIGDPAGSVIDEDNTGVLKHRGEEVTTRLDNATLEEIARITGGVYIPLATAATGRNNLGNIHREYVRRITAEETQESGAVMAVERFQWFLVPGIALALVAAALSSGRPGRKKLRN